MTENGDPLENAIAERVNGILKTEWLMSNIPDTKREAVGSLPGIIESYNTKRPHMSIGLLTPEAAHQGSGELNRMWKNYYFKN
eukprot:gene25133-gene22460